MTGDGTPIRFGIEKNVKSVKSGIGVAGQIANPVTPLPKEKNVKTLTVTRVLSDVDTVAMMGYAQADNRNDFIRDYCHETYGYHHMLLHRLVGAAFKETASIFGVDTEPRKSKRDDYRSIQMEALY